MMTASGRKKRLFTLAGLLLLLVAGLLWHAGALLQSSRKEVRKAVPRAAGAPPPAAVVTKKLAEPASTEAIAGSGAAMTVRKKLPALPAVVAAVPFSAPKATESLPLQASEGSAAPGVASDPVAAPPAAASPAPPAAEPPAPAPAAASAAPAPPKPAAPADISKTGQAAFPYSILLSSCREKENALAALSRFRRSGAALYIVRSEVKGKGAWWRVMSGAYRSADEAGQARKALGDSGAVVVRTPFANRLGAFSSEAAAAVAMAQAKALGYFPYLMQGAGGSVELLVGAFPAEAEAKNLQRELKVQGVASEVVRR